MNESYREIEEDYRAGLITPEDFQKWRSYFERQQPDFSRYEEAERPDTLNASTRNECEYANTQTQHLPIFDRVIVWLLEPVNLGFAIIGMILLESWLW